MIEKHESLQFSKFILLLECKVKTGIISVKAGRLRVKQRRTEMKADLAEAQFSSDFIYSCSFRIIHQFKAVLSGILKHKRDDCHD